MAKNQQYRSRRSTYHASKATIDGAVPETLDTASEAFRTESGLKRVAEGLAHHLNMSASVEDL